MMLQGDNPIGIWCNVKIYVMLISKILFSTGEIYPNNSMALNETVDEEVVVRSDPSDGSNTNQISLNPVQPSHRLEHELQPPLEVWVESGRVCSC